MNRITVGIVAMAAGMAAAVAGAGDVNGGTVTKPFSGKVLCVVNAQERLDGAAVERATDGLVCEMRLWREIVKPGEVVAKDIGMRIEIVDVPGERVLLVAPGEFWAKINIRPLAADNPTAAKLASRLQKSFWRAGAFALGAGYSHYEGCLMRPILTLSDLDRAPDSPCPEPFNAMIDSLKAAGLGVRKTVSYRQACREGWAPAPTNEVQKAIWEKAHAIPKNPIKIEFDPKKGK